MKKERNRRRRLVTNNNNKIIVKKWKNDYFVLQENKRRQAVSQCIAFAKEAYRTSFYLYGCAQAKLCNTRKAIADRVDKVVKVLLHRSVPFAQPVLFFAQYEVPKDSARPFRRCGPLVCMC